MVLVLKDVRKFSVFPVTAIDDPVLPEVLAVGVRMNVALARFS
ncbi:hypothetical protein [Streptomyces flavidovirens]